MIILDGSDCVGKTTTAERLRALAGPTVGLELGYRHLSRPPPDFDHMREYMEGVGQHVQDRYHLSSIVYGKILGGGTYISARRMLTVQRYLRWQGALVVVFYGGREWLRDQLAKSVKKEMYSREQILDANDAFKALATVQSRGEPLCDMSIDVSAGWPTDETLKGLLTAWGERWTR